VRKGTSSTSTSTPRTINYVEFSIILSPYLEPLITAFIVSSVSWRWAFWLCTIMAAVAWVLVVLFLDETLFDRRIPDSQRIVAEKGRHWQQLLGLEQDRTLHQRSLAQSLMRPVVAITKIPVLFVIIYYFLNTARVVAVNTTVSIWLTDYYGFTTRQIGEIQDRQWPSEKIFDRHS
jgi:MFS family permease